MVGVKPIRLQASACIWHCLLANSLDWRRPGGDGRGCKRGRNRGCVCTHERGCVCVRATNTGSCCNTSGGGAAGVKGV